MGASSGTLQAEAELEGDARYPQQPIHLLIQEQAQRRPDAVAVSCGAGDITYAQFDAWTVAIAEQLRLRTDPGGVVAVLMGKTRELVAAYIGVLKAGMVHVSPPQPVNDYTVKMLKDCECHLAVAMPEYVQELHGALPDSVEVLPMPPMPTGGAVADQRHAEAPGNVRAGSLDAVAYLMYTSGSTGEPKAVQVAHRGVVRLVRATNYHTFDSGSAMLFHSPTSFDVCIAEIYGPLLNGGRVVPFDHPSIEHRKMRGHIEQFGVNTLWLTSRLFDAIVDAAPNTLAEPVAHVLFGGDAMSPPHVRKCLELHRGLRLVNCYGPTENTVYSTYRAFSSPDDVPDFVSIGVPISHSSCYVLDARLRDHASPDEIAQAQVADGQEGELWLGGDGVAHGYLKRMEETEKRFRSDPFSGRGRFLYRTGDMVRWTRGELQFLGRRDGQAKINGQRVELDEVRHRLAGLPGAGQCEVLADSNRLLAFVVSEVRGAELLAQMRRLVPAHLVPAEVVNVSGIPLTRHGKADRQALLGLLDRSCRGPSAPVPAALAAAAPLPPPPSSNTPTPALVVAAPAAAAPVPAGGGSTSTGRAAPSGAAAPSLEAVVLDSFREALDDRALGLDADLFESGGDSLKVLRLQSTIEQHAGLNLEPWTVYQHPTPRALVNHLLQDASDCVASERSSATVLVVDELQEQPDAFKTVLASFTQEDMVFEYLADGMSSRQNEFILLQIASSVPRDLLERAAQGLVALHEPMRTHFELRDRKVWQRIAPPESAEAFRVTVHPLPTGELLEVARKPIRDAWQEKFDLFARPPFQLIRFEAEGGQWDLLLIKAHHVVWDGFALPLVVKDLARCFTQESGSKLVLEGPSYSEYSTSLRTKLNTGGRRERQLAYWMSKLNGALSLKRLPVLQGRKAQPAGDPENFLRAQAHRFQLVDGLEGLCKGAGSTPYRAVAAAFFFALAKETGSLDIVVGITFANRSPALKSLVGFCVNMLALRVQMKPGMTFLQLLKEVDDAILGAISNADVPFHEVLASLRKYETREGRQDSQEPGAGGPALFHAILNSRDTSRETTNLKVHLGGSEAMVRHWGYSFGEEITVKYPLILEADLQPRAQCCTFESDPEVFPRELVQRLTGHVTAVISEAVARPDVTLWELHGLVAGGGGAIVPAQSPPSSTSSSSRNGATTASRASLEPMPSEANAVKGVDGQPAPSTPSSTASWGSSGDGAVAATRAPLERDLAEADAVQGMDEQSVQQGICELWGQILGQQVSPTDDFANLGGTSLHTVHVCEAIQDRFGVEVTPQQLGANQRVWQLARLVVSLVHSGPEAAAQRRAPILIVGAGVAGLMAALECQRLGVPFELVEREGGFGGVWLHACNQTSTLQSPKDLYSLDSGVAFPTLDPEDQFPGRQGVLGHIRAVAARHGLVGRTRFHTELSTVREEGGQLVATLQAPGREEELRVAGLLVATGKHSSRQRMVACPVGASVRHSSQLDGVEMRGLDVLVVGGGSGAVEAACLAYSKGARSITMLPRTAHWVLPTRALPVLRKFLTPTLRPSRHYAKLARALRVLMAFVYREHGIEHMVPAQGNQAFDTSISVNDQFFELARSGRGRFMVGEVRSVELTGGTGAMRVVTSGGEALQADLLISAIGYEEPAFPFLSQLCGGRVPGIYKGYLLEADHRVGFLGFYDMLLSHTKTLPLNITMCLKAILDESMRPSAEDLRRWSRQAPTFRNGGKAHLSWLMEEVKSLAKRRAPTWATHPRPPVATAEAAASSDAEAIGITAPAALPETGFAAGGVGQQQWETVMAMRQQMPAAVACRLVGKETLCESERSEPVRRLRFVLPDGAEMTADAAMRQVVLVHVPLEDQRLETRFYSPTTAPAREDRTFEIAVRVYRGREGVSSWLDDQPIGAEVRMNLAWPPVLSPDRRNAGHRVGLIAAGVAVAELQRVAQVELQDPDVSEVVLLYATRTREEQQLFARELGSLQAHHGSRFRQERLLSREQAVGFHYGRVSTDLLRRTFPWHEGAADPRDARFLVAGTQSMKKAAWTCLEKLGYSRAANELIREVRA